MSHNEMIIDENYMKKAQEIQEISQYRYIKTEKNVTNKLVEIITNTEELEKHKMKKDDLQNWKTKNEETIILSWQFI